MQMTDLLAQMGDIQSVARDLGVSQGDVATGADALLPAILGGFKKQARSSPVGGPQGLAGLLGQLGGSASFTRCCHPSPPMCAWATTCWGRYLAPKTSAARWRRALAHRPGWTRACSSRCCRCWPCWWRATWPNRASRRSARDSASGPGGLEGMLGGLLGGGAGAARGRRAGCWSPWRSGRHAGHERRRQLTGDILRMASKAMR